MILIKPDYTKRVSIPGVLDPVPRPIDIDASGTGFRSLRTLRIYEFDEGSAFEGHAEEDEVFVVVLSGTIELAITAADSSDTLGPCKLSALDGSDGLACAAYLPPSSAYQLTASSKADVAYARATPMSSNPPKFFARSARGQAPGINCLWEETAYAQRLGVRLLQMDASEKDVTIAPFSEEESMYEGLIHLRTASLGSTTYHSLSDGQEPTFIGSRDTIVIEPGEHVNLNFLKGSKSLVLIVFAAGDGKDLPHSSST